MEKRKDIYKLIFVIVAVLSMMVIALEISFAWFMSNSMTDNSGTGVKVIGTIGLDVTYDFSFYNDALSPDTYVLTDKQGDDIATYIKTSSANNIDGVFVKVKFMTNIAQLSLYFDEDDIISDEVVTYASSTCDDRWILSMTETQGSGTSAIYIYEYYYVGKIGSTNVTFNTGYYVNNHINNSHAKNGVYIKMEVYGLQSQYGAYLEDEDWQTAPTIFKTYASLATGY